MRYSASILAELVRIMRTKRACTGSSFSKSSAYVQGHTRIRDAADPA